jgi:hypothetical protein
MDLTGTRTGYFTMSGSQKGDGRDGLNRPGIVQGQLNWSGPEEIVESDPIGDESTAGLKQNMSVSNAAVQGRDNIIKNSL